MDWIHCNSCYLLPTQSKGKKFSLTSCGHVYCEDCFKRNGTKKCAVCGNALTPLPSDMSPATREYFRNPKEMLKRALQIMTFQEGHRSRITTYFNSVVLKYKAAKEEITRLNGVIKRQEKDNRDLKQQLMLLKQKLQKETPVIACSNSSTNMNSHIQSSKPHDFNSISSQMNLPPVSTATHMNSGMSTDGISLLRSSEPSMPQASHWITPRRPALRKMPRASTGLSSFGTTSPPMFSPITPQNTFNYAAMYRPNILYGSQPNTPSTPGTPLTPESTRYSPLGTYKP